MRVLAAAAILALGAAAASAQTDPARPQALLQAAKAVRGAVETFGGAAATLADAAEAAGAAAETDAGPPATGTPAFESASGKVLFLDPLDDTPLEVPEEREASAAVRHFRATAENPYAGDEEAIAEGEKLYNRLCAACHLKDGTGRIGPNLIDDSRKYPRTDTAKGLFEIIYAGGAGAMQPFHQRMSQDEMLRLIAYLDVLGAK